MTPYQEKLLVQLRKGGRIAVNIAGWRYRNRRIMEPTCEALRQSGELVEITLKGQHGYNWRYVCHRDQTEYAARGVEILKQTEPV